MKQTLAVALVFIALLGIGSIWVAYDRSQDALNAPQVDAMAQPDSSAPGTAQQGGSVAQVIQKIMPQAPLAPEIATNTWFNSPALSTQDLRGHVVVVEFWTFG